MNPNFNFYRVELQDKVEPSFKFQNLSQIQVLKEK